MGATKFRLNAFICSLVLLSLTSLAAKRWLDFKAGRIVAPAASLLAYVLLVWKAQPAAYEWYTLPPALCLFGWIWTMCRGENNEFAEGGNTRESREINLLLGAASMLALGPSFIQSLPGCEHSALHFFVLLGVSLAIVMGAMLSRRKIPLLFGSSICVLTTLIQGIYWAQHQKVLLPVAGIMIGFGVLLLASLFESRMNHVFRQAMDRARAEARMFWVSWQ